MSGAFAAEEISRNVWHQVRSVKQHTWSGIMVAVIDLGAACILPLVQVKLVTPPAIEVVEEFVAHAIVSISCILSIWDYWPEGGCEVHTRVGEDGRRVGVDPESKLAGLGVDNGDVHGLVVRGVLIICHLRTQVPLLPLSAVCQDDMFFWVLKLLSRQQLWPRDWRMGQGDTLGVE